MLDINGFEAVLRSRSSGLVAESAYEPELNDLYFLYSQVREKAVVSILEYGSGWSTLALAIGLQENYLQFGKRYLEIIRHPNPFKLLTLDASEHWQSVAISRLSDEERLRVVAGVAKPVLGNFGGVICHFSDYIPNFTPDLIYLDGPDHDQVTGGFSGFEYDERFTPPMAGDILTIEPYLWPETILICDGRTANARFLESRFKRNWEFLHDPFGDRTISRISETAFGVISEEHINFRLQCARELQNKENPER
jgi:hypothetical protein